ncbi:MAG: MotA/TolQ/ExbB proton channel family protein [Thermoguttaceae bacterium]
MTSVLVDILYFIATCLLLPVLLVLFAFMAGTLFTLGGLAREAVQRRRTRPAWRRFLADLRTGAVSVQEFYDSPRSGYVERFRRQTAPFRDNGLAVKKCLDDVEIDIACRMARLSLATRVGPMLGLVGTLIPLGPALTGLANGSLDALAGNLIIAFTTTVFGIVVGGSAYAICLVRRAWYEQDVSDLEFLVALRFSGEGQSFPLGSEESRLV